MYRHFAQITLILALFLVSESVFAEDRNINEKYKIPGGTIDINVDIVAGDLTILPSGKKSELKVTAEYDTEECEIDIDYNKGNGTLNITTDHKPFNNHDRNYHSKVVEITVELPYNPEIDLNIECKAGDMDIQLGGLSIKQFDLDNCAGKIDIDFDKANRITLDRFVVDLKAGNLDLNTLGNAHFSDARINNNVGELSVDFSGDILADVSADIDINVGEINITIPKKVGTKMKVSRFNPFNSEKHYASFDKKGSSYYSDNYDNSDNLLSLNVSSGLGGLDIRMK